MQDLKPSKTPGPDGIRKEDLIIDITQAASCLTINDDLSQINQLS